MSGLEHRDRVVLLRQALAELPETLRTAVLMRDIREMSYQEIADTLRLPEGTVKSRINRGRRELARQVMRLRHQAEWRRGSRTPSGGAPAPPARH
jgi:RNA polymerase sigma-70 factor (ECF subfamily)